MAVNIFEQYGIKEVANVYFEALAAEESAGIKAGDIVLYLDSLKVSTVETTAENVSATGGILPSLRQNFPKLLEYL